MGLKLTQEQLKELLHYNPETGVFTWLSKVSKKVVVGSRAGTSRPNGYRLVGLLGTKYHEHHLAILYTEGTWPELEVDHINGVPSDNRIANLRRCSRAENHQNRKLSTHNESGMQGVSWHKLRRQWRSCIQGSGKQHHLGLFTTKDEAYAAYLTAKASLHLFQPTPRSQ